jgi:hypothetical protein
MRLRRTLWFLVASFALALTVFAAAAQPQGGGTPGGGQIESNSTGDRSNIMGFERVLSSLEFWLSVTTIAFTILIVAAEFYMIAKAKHISYRPDDVLRLIITTIIIGGTLFFLAAGFSSQQIAPAVGLFGTVVGYLLGSAERSRSSSHPSTGKKETDEDKQDS